MADFLITNVPIEIAPDESYLITIPSSMSQNDVSSDCGSIQSVDNSTLTLVVADINSLYGVDQCTVTIESTAFNVNMLLASFWSNPIYFGPVISHAPTVLTVNETMPPIQLPFASNIVTGGFTTPNIIFIADPPFPSGIYASSNYVVGTPNKVGTTTVTIYAQDVFNKLELAIGNYTFVVVHPASSSSTAVILSTVIFIPLLAAGLFILALFIVRQRRKAMQPYDFSTLVAENAVELRPDIPRRHPRELHRSAVHIIEELGKGSFAVVNKGFLSESGTPRYLVAVKSLINSMDQASDRIQLLAEASLMVQFDHENVVRLIGVVTSGDPLLIILEYCEGGSMEMFLNEGILDQLRQMKFSIDCARGMVYLSSLNFVHRDLAARNVFISSDLTAKIGDFGLSRENIDQEYYISRNATVSIRWAAPEALEERRFSQQSDVWSYGVLLWEIWSGGSLPFKELTATKAWSAVLHGMRLDRPADCPLEIYAAMKSCWTDYGTRPPFTMLLKELISLQSVGYGYEESIFSSAPVAGSIQTDRGIETSI